MLPGLPSGELAKMVISAFKDENVSPASLLGVFTVQFNPNQYSRKLAKRVKVQDVQGNHSPNVVYGGADAEEISLEFLFDGTGVVPGGLSINATPSPKGLAKQALNQSGALGIVEGMVQQFLTLTYEPNQEIHQPPYLILSWGTFQFTCKLKSADVSYSLFDSLGRPLRAKINATFIEQNPPEFITKLLDFRSPDLTRYHEVAQNETLPQLADKIYEDPAYYLKLAKSNKLNHFRRLRTGSTLRMPPLTNAPEESDS